MSSSALCMQMELDLLMMSDYVLNEETGAVTH
jgi:hypothetical protein